MFDWVLNTPDIQTFEGKTQQKFILCYRHSRLKFIEIFDYRIPPSCLDPWNYNTIRNNM